MVRKTFNLSVNTLVVLSLLGAAVLMAVLALHTLVIGGLFAWHLIH
jgi:hypothetical protein